MRLMTMRTALIALAIGLGMAGCTASHPVSFDATALCHKHFPTTRLTQPSTVEAMRSIGPRTVLTAGSASQTPGTKVPGVVFAGLPPPTPIALCMIDSGRTYTVFGVTAAGQVENLWSQNGGERFQIPG